MNHDHLRFLKLLSLYSLNSSWKQVLAFTVAGVLINLLIVAVILVAILFNKSVYIVQENEAFRDVCLTKNCLAAGKFQFND